MPRIPPRRIVLLTSLLTISSLWLAAQQPASTASGANGPVATIRTTARLVVLDVVVNDGHGHPLKGLQASDFALSEDGVPQTISSFTEHDGTIVPAAVPAVVLPPNTFAVQPPVTGSGAMTVIVLGHIAFQDAPFVRDQLKAYLKTTSPATPIAIFSLDDMGMRLVQGFTSDHKILQETASSQRILPPLGLEPMGSYVRHGTLQLSQYLNTIPGRVNVIWFSSDGSGAPRVGGIRPEDAFSDVYTFANNLQGPANVLRLSRIAVYPVSAGGLPAAAPSMPVAELFADIDGAPIFINSHLAEMAEATGGKAFYNTNNFKDAIDEVVNTGTHYYTISYTPTNHNWDGGFRNINLNADAGNISRLGQFLDWMNDRVKIEYRRGYFAYNAPPHDVMSWFGPSSAEVPAAPVQPGQPARRLISVSPKGNPGLGRGGQDDPLHRAMAFATPTPIDLPFHITVTPSPEEDRPKADQPLPKDNYLTQYWKTTPYRNYKVHYSIDPKDMYLHTAADGARTMFRFVIVIYRDNGEPVNSIATTVSVDAKAADYKQILRDGLNFDQTIAIPTKINTNAVPVTANFFLRTGVEEVETGRIGAVEVPAEWVKVSPVKVAGEGPADHPSP